MDTSKLRATYDTIAHDFAKEHENDDWDNDMIEGLAALLPPGVRILDLGCGPGAETKKLFDSGFTMTGFDLSEKLLNIAKTKTPGATFIQGDMLLPFPFEDSSFDAVFAKASLLHIPKAHIDHVLGEIWRILSPSGYIHIALKEGDGEATMRENEHGYDYERFFAFWRMNEFVQVLTKHGFRMIKESTYQRPGGHTTWLKFLAQKH